MGCGKSKHDVVTGNTRTVRKPSSEAGSVKGKEKETTKRQESCTCQKTNDISAAVSSNQPETTVEDSTKKLTDKEAGVGFREKPASETNDEQKEEEKEAIILPPVKAIIVPENIVVEETVNDVDERALPMDEQKVAEKVDIETVTVEEKGMEDKVDSNDVDTENAPAVVEEPRPGIETPVTTKSEVEEISTTEHIENEPEENVEVASTEKGDILVPKEEDKVVEEKTAKEAGSA